LIELLRPPTLALSGTPAFAPIPAGAPAGAPAALS
jgi:hypothetical protein